MSLILSIETATETCSVAISNNRVIVASKHSEPGTHHASSLSPFISEVIAAAGISLQELDAVAVSMGPGSYTGLRIGVSTAKGLCYSLDKPLIAIGTLPAMAKQAKDASANDNLLNPVYCPMIDARRMEVFTALFDHDLKELQPADAIILDQETFRSFNDKNILIFGNGADKCRELYAGFSNISFLNGISASAEPVALLAHDRLDAGTFENTAYFEPFYLKDFIAGKPKVKGLYNT